MAKNDEVVSTEAAAPAISGTYTEIAQVRMQALKEWREAIPRLAIPPTGDATQRLSAAASVPTGFIELTNIAVTNHRPLVRVESVTPAESRDLVGYADAFGPLADELEALAHFVRYSTTYARHVAGTEALTTYSLAERLSKRPETAYLRPHVADMRRALGRARKLTPEEAARKAAERAEKAAARAAKRRLALPPAAAPTSEE